MDKRILVVIGCILLITVSSLSGCLSAKASEIEPISYNGHEGYSGGKYAIFIDASLKNKGEAQTVIVWASISFGGGYWKQSKSVSFSSGETKSLTFIFTDIPQPLTPTELLYKIWLEIGGTAQAFGNDIAFIEGNFTI